IPCVDAVGVAVDALLHAPAGGQAHRAGAPAPGDGPGSGPTGPGAALGSAGRRAVARRGRRRRGKPAGHRLGGPELHAAEALLAGDLALDRVAHPEGHGDELADGPLAGTDPVEPGLGGRHQVVLRAPVEVLAPGLAGDRADLAHPDLHRPGLPVLALE